MDGFYNGAFTSATDGQFDAYCLSGIRTEDNTGAGIDTNDAYLDPLGYIWIVAYPDTNIAKPGDPREFNTPEGILGSIRTFKGAGFWVRSNYLAYGNTAPSFGQKLTMYFEEGSISNSDWAKPRFVEPQALPDFGDHSFRKLSSVEGLVSATTAFSDGLASLLGIPGSTGNIYTKAQEQRDAGNTKIRGRSLPDAKPGDLELAKEIGIDVNILRAFRLIESGKLGATALRFEPHLWYKRKGTDPPLGWTRSDTYVFSEVGSETGKSAFEAAYAVDPKTAVKVTSWGLYQVMGYWALKAYPSAAAFYKAFKKDASAASDQMVVAWFKANPKAIVAANNLDFTALAEEYNGSKQALSFYDALIAEAYVLAKEKYQ